MKEKTELKTNWIWIVIGVACLVILGVYFVVFHGNLSAISQDWASFGGYVSGIMMPILTGINIWVFIKLTKAIDDNNYKRLEEDAKRQEERHKSELEFQKRRMLTELRQNEINALMNIISIMGMGGSNKTEVINRVKSVRFYFETFGKSKQSLFSCFDTELLKAFTDIDSTIDRACQTRENEINLEKILELANMIISKLQEYTIDNI